MLVPPPRSNLLSSPGLTHFLRRRGARARARLSGAHDRETWQSRNTAGKRYNGTKGREKMRAEESAPRRDVRYYFIDTRRISFHPSLSLSLVGESRGRKRESRCSLEYFFPFSCFLLSFFFFSHRIPRAHSGNNAELRGEFARNGLLHRKR